jgi:hypothetical protein
MSMCIIQHFLLAPFEVSSLNSSRKQTWEEKAIERRLWKDGQNLSFVGWNGA